MKWIVTRMGNMAGKLHQMGSYKTDLPLLSHIKSAHGGKVDPECRACAEIQKHMKEGIKW